MTKSTGSIKWHKDMSTSSGTICAQRWIHLGWHEDNLVEKFYSNMGFGNSVY